MDGEEALICFAFLTHLSYCYEGSQGHVPREDEAQGRLCGVPGSVYLSCVPQLPLGLHALLVSGEELFPTLRSGSIWTMDGDTIALPRSRKENKDHDYRFIFAKSYTYCVIQIHMA